MGQSPEELRREIEQTRMGMSENLDAIGDRVSPGRIVERRTNRVRNSVTSLRERVMGRLKGRPFRRRTIDQPGAAVQLPSGDLHIVLG